LARDTPDCLSSDKTSDSSDVKALVANLIRDSWKEEINVQVIQCRRNAIDEVCQDWIEDAKAMDVRGLQS